MTRLIRGGAILALALGAVLMSAGHSGATAGATTEGLTIIDEGASAYYSPSYTGAGWERIRQIQAANYGLDPSQVYDDAGFYCVKIGFSPGNLLTLRNPRTGTTITCMTADVNASEDNAVWKSRWIVETSWLAFRALGLQNGNDVQVLVMLGG